MNATLLGRARDCSALVLAAAAAQAQTARTPWGDPDLQGTWSNATLTPLQRPAELGDKEFFTEDEAKAYVRQRIAATSGDANIEADRSSGQRRLLQRRVDGSRQRHRADAAHVADRRARERPRSAVHGRGAARARAQPGPRAKAHPADTPEDRYLDGALHRVRRRPRADAARAVQQQLLHRANARLRHDHGGAQSRGPHHSDRRPSALARGRAAVDRRFARPLRGRHARRRDHEPDTASALLRRADARLRDERRVSRRRALHAHGRRSDPLSRHGARPRVHGAVDRRDLHASADRASSSSSRVTKATTVCAAYCRPVREEERRATEGKR